MKLARTKRVASYLLWGILLIAPQFLYTSDAALINNLTRYIPTPEAVKQALLNLQNPLRTLQPCTLTAAQADWPLYRAYQNLKKTLPRAVLCNLPTPVYKLNQCGKELGIDLYIKRDDLTGKKGHFGGNKPRKLETVLADALRHNADTVITFGCIGSNHAVATADCAKQLGLRCILMLKPQATSHVVQRNLLLMQHFGAKLRFSPNGTLRDLDVVNLFLHHTLDCGTFPYLIPTGAETALGAVGYVNAAFELNEQIQQGLIPEPDVIYVATGGFGHQQGLLGATIAGLIVGCKAAGLKTKLVGVFTEPEKKDIVDRLLLEQCKETVALLHAADNNFPLLHIASTDFTIINDCAGTGYGIYSPEGNAAIALLKTTDNITLDGTYTGKAFAGLVRDARSGVLRGKKVLFWNTFCNNDFEHLIKKSSYKRLPCALQKFFEMPIQQA